MDNSNSTFVRGASEWVAERLRTHDCVSSCEILSDISVLVRRKGRSDVIVGTLRSEHVTVSQIRTILSDVRGIRIIANSRNLHTVDPGVYSFCEEEQVGFGGITSLFRGIGHDPIPAILDPQASFILRGLRQHNNVLSASRINFCRYLVERPEHRSVEFVAIEAYEVTAEILRSAVERYGKAEVLVCTNPYNGGLTKEASEMVKLAGWQVMRWKDFYGALNKPNL